MRADELLVLDYNGFGRRLARLFAGLAGSEDRRMLFLRDPTGTLAATLFNDFGPIPLGQIQFANRILFSLLSNKKFLAWAGKYQQSLEKEAKKSTGQDNVDIALRQYLIDLDRRVLLQDFTEAAAQFADQELMLAMMSPPPGSVSTTPDPGGGDGPGPQCRLDGEDSDGPLNLCPIGPPQRPFPSPSPGGVVYVEVAVAVVAVVLVTVVVTQIDATPRPLPTAVSRSDLKIISDTLGKHLVARAQLLRSNGSLTGDYWGRYP